MNSGKPRDDVVGMDFVLAVARSSTSGCYSGSRRRARSDLLGLSNAQYLPAYAALAGATIAVVLILLLTPTCRPPQM